MTLKKIAAVVISAGLLAAGFAPAANAAEGNTSLAEVLTSDTNKFDNNWGDFDILTEAVLAVLAAKPDSPVSVLTDGDVALTAFIPTDRAFRKLVFDLTGTRPATERATFRVVASLGVDTIEQILLYHVIVGPAIDSSAALGANGVKLQTAAGTGPKNRIEVRVYPRVPAIWLRDTNTKLKNPKVLLSKVDINAGNKQIAHGINRVLMTR